MSSTELNTIEVNGIEGLQALLERDVGPTAWKVIDQELIDRYAELTGDHQWIHTDPERAARETPYGRTIAHGNLTLALIDGMRASMFEVSGFQMAINYGFERVRYPAPVPEGSRIRVVSRLTSLEELDGGWWHAITRNTVELKGSEKPCCVTDSVVRFLPA